MIFGLLGNVLAVPRDPGSPSENRFMEPKYDLLFGGDWTSQSSADKVIGSLGNQIIVCFKNLCHLEQSDYPSKKTSRRTLFEKI